MAEPRLENTGSQAPRWALWVLGLFAALMALVMISEGSILYRLPKEEPATEYWAAFIWAAFNAIIATAAAIWLLTPRSETPGPVRRPPTAPAKMLMLSVGGFLGLSLVVLGLVYVFLWWDVAVGGLFSGRAAWKGGDTWQHWRPYIVVALMLGGLAIMFASLITVRSEERTNPTLRRLVYGYSTVLTGLLVLAILAAVNVLGFFYVQENGIDPFDWTESHIYSIAPGTRKLLQSVQEPIDIYVVLSRRSALYEDVATLLASFKSVKKNIAIYHVSPGDPEAFGELMQKFNVVDDNGVLVVYNPTDNPNVQFLKAFPDLEGVSRSPDGQQERAFKGEEAIVRTIEALREGKVKKTLYFTQDNGELSLDEPSSGRQLDAGLGRLKLLLSEGGVYEPKPLDLGDSAKVPNDALAVVIAGPRRPFSPGQIEALREYMKREGKLVVLLDVDREHRPIDTGLDTFLAEFGVQVGRDVILNGIDGADRTVCIAQVAPSADTAFREAFFRIPFLLPDCRSVRPATGSEHGFLVTPLLETVRSTSRYQWAETNPQELLRNKEEFDRKRRLRTDPVPVAVTVREARPASGDVHAEGAPRLVVFGDSTFVSNGAIEDPRLGVYYERLFTSSLSWLRGRPEGVDASKAVTRKTYKVNLNADKSFTLRTVPGLILVLGILGCAAGVWIMRRR